MAASESSDLYMNPDGVRQSLAVFEDLMATLQQETITLQQALAAAEAGDPHGYLTKGLEHGYNAVHGGNRVVAMFDELLRNAHATVNAVETHDRAVQLGPVAPTFGSAHTSSTDPAAALSLGQSILTQGGLQSQSLHAPTILPGGPMFDATGTLIRFDLTVAEFDMLTAHERIHWALEMERLVGKGPWFHNIIDIITFFDQSHTLHNLTPGSWMSYADAAILEALQNGYMLHLGLVPVSMSGGAAEKWRDFIDYVVLHHPILNDDDKRMQAKSLWAIAEQYSINYGLAEADTHVGRPILGTDEGDLTRNFIAAGNLYRLIGRLPGGGAMLGRIMSQRVGNIAGAAADTVLGSPLMPEPVQSIYDLLEYVAGHDPLKTSAGEVTQWVGGDMASELGEAITDPRTTWGPHGMYWSTQTMLIGQLPKEHPTGTWGPTFMFAKVVEQQTLKRGGTLPLPLGYHINPAGTLTFVNGSVLMPDGTLVTTDGTHLFPDGRILDGSGAWLLTPDDVVIRDDGSLQLPNGYMTDPIF